MRVRHDLFPANITVVPPDITDDFKSVLVSSSCSKIHTGARYLEKVRLVILEDEESSVILVAADHHTGPRLIFSERLQDSGLNWSGNKSDDSQAITRSGKIIAFKYVKGCNCGSRLRSWSPYQTMDSIKDPTT
jgi:hypothetical protein